MRRWIMAVLVGLTVAACGDAATSSTTILEVPGATTTHSDSSSTVAVSTTLVLPSSTSSSQELDRSILSLGLMPGEGRPGRFRLEPGPNTKILMLVEGRYWVGDEGNVYIALDVDTELIAEQMAVLADTLEAMEDPLIDSPYFTSLREHYRGDEFQIGLTDLIRSIAVGGWSAEWAEQWAWFIQADGDPVPEELMACRDAIASLDEAARTWVGDLEIEFVDGIWLFPLADFEEALAEEFEETSVCELFFEPLFGMPESDVEIVISRFNEPDGWRIEVLVDDNIYTDREPESMFAIVFWPDESVGPAPSNPNPAPLLTLRGSYLTAIGVCGELPWIYSNFAAADTYYPPDGDWYPGPVVSTSGWYCEDRVPVERRNHDR